MKRWAKLASRFYPRAWRARYGEEFEALLEDAPLRAGDVWNVLKAACTMRISKLNWLTITGAFAVSGALIAGIWSVARPASPVSRALFSTDAPVDALIPTLQQALSRHVLGSIIVHDDLYASDRTRIPLEDTVQKMRKDLRMEILPNRGKRVFTISFAYPDAVPGRRAILEVADAFQSAMKGAAKVDLVEVASLPRNPAEPDRWKLILRVLAGGGLTGLLISGAWALLRKRGPGSLTPIVGLTALGMVAGGGVALMLPDQYTATAVLRMTGAPDSNWIARTVTDEALTRIAQSEQISFQRQRGAPPIETLVREMRRHIEVRRISQRLGANGMAFTVSYRDSDRERAARVTRRLAAVWIEANLAKPVGVIELLDPPSQPITPSSPNRLAIILSGVVLGLLAGIVAASVRRARTAPA
jgi:hypothetical protein